MTKVKRNLRKSTRRTTKRMQKSKRSVKSRKLRRQTRNRRSKMRGGFKLINLLAGLFAVAKVMNPSEYNGKTIGPQEQLEYAIKNKSLLQDQLKDPESPIYTTGLGDFESMKDIVLSDVLGDIMEREEKESLDEILLTEIASNKYNVQSSLPIMETDKINQLKEEL